MIATLAMFMVGAGFVLGSIGVSMTRKTRGAALKELLEDELDKSSRSPEDLSDLMERAGAFAERALGKTQSAGKLRFKLVQSGSTMKVGEFGTTLAVTAVVLAAIMFVMTKSLFLALGTVVLVPVIGMVRLSGKARKRVLKLESQLPEVLQLIAGSLDSGTSLLVAMELAGEEGDAPLANELARVVAESGVGRPLLEALDAMAARIGSRDISWTAKAIRIQNQTGGKLAETLRVLADFMGARQEVRGEIRALSAEAKISGKVLVAMPICIGIFFYFSRRAYMEPLISTTIGHVMLAGSAVGMLIGYLWMRKMSNVEI